MSILQQYEQFHLTPELLAHLQSFSKPLIPDVKKAERVIVETIVITDGERKVIHSEDRHAELGRVA